MSGSAPADDTAPARLERAAIAALCLMAMVRVFLFAAAFPFFNNMDEQAHTDLVVKYARGYWPNQPEETYDRATAELVATYGTLEFLNSLSRFPGGVAPAPVWARPNQDLGQERTSRLNAWLERTNHEAHSPPLYYLIAAPWYRLGRALGFNGIHGLYWVRFLNAPLAALLVWCTYVFCRSGYPGRRELHLGVPLLVAFMPFDPWYAINSDAIAPLLSVMTLLAILR